MRYKVGDKVRVRKDLEIGQMFGDSYMFTRSMNRYSGSVLTIRSVNKDCYGVEETYSCWTDDMFEDIVPKKWRIEISGTRYYSSAQLFIDNEITPSKYEEITCYAHDELSVEAAAEAVVEKLLKPKPKFRDGDIVSTGEAHHQVAGRPKYDNVANSFLYDVEIAPDCDNNKIVTLSENELIFIRRGDDCD